MSGIWILWKSEVRMAAPNLCPIWTTPPDVYDSKEECELALKSAISSYVERLKNYQPPAKDIRIEENAVFYAEEDSSHPSGFRDIRTRWQCLPAGFNPNDRH